MKPTLPFAQYDKDTNHLHILHKDIPKGVTNLYSEAFLRQLQAEISEIKHMNKNWQISEGMALQEIELAKEFLKANELYFSYVVWRHTK